MNIPSSITELEEVVGTRNGFFEDLLNIDDWSFVIKLHAFFEALCTQLLLFHFNQPELKDIFSRLELSNKATGKIAFLGKLGLISKENRRFLSALSELRNKLVHEVHNCEFKFSDYLDSINSDTTKKLAISFSPFESFVRQVNKVDTSALSNIEGLKEQANIDSVVERFRDNPKEHIHIGARNVIVNLINSHYYSDYRQWVLANAHLGTNAEKELEKKVVKDLVDAVRKKSNQ